MRRCNDCFGGTDDRCDKQIYEMKALILTLMAMCCLPAVGTAEQLHNIPLMLSIAQSLTPRDSGNERTPRQDYRHETMHNAMRMKREGNELVMNSKNKKHNEHGGLSLGTECDV